MTFIAQLKMGPDSISRPELLISTKEVTCRTYNHIYLYSLNDACSEMQFCKIRFEESLIVKGAIQNYISFSNIIFLLDGMHFHISEKS